MLEGRGPGGRRGRWPRGSPQTDAQRQPGSQMTVPQFLSSLRNAAATPMAGLACIQACWILISGLAASWSPVSPPFLQFQSCSPEPVALDVTHWSLGRAQGLGTRKGVTCFRHLPQKVRPGGRGEDAAQRTPGL